MRRTRRLQLTRQFPRTPGPVESNGDRRPYSHRFFVRPHWRRFHTKSGVEWRPVVGYVKGPDDAPFVPKNIVYEWSR